MEIKKEERNRNEWRKGLNEWWVGGNKKKCLKERMNKWKEGKNDWRKEEEWMMDRRKKRTDEWTKWIYEVKITMKGMTVQVKKQVNDWSMERM